MCKQLRNATLLFTALFALASCKNGGFLKKKPQKSDATGWNYNDKTQGGFFVAKPKDVKTGPGLVFVQGGTFTMGSTQEDVMSDWNNVPRRVTVNSFFIDKTEVANVHYREYIHWLDNVFQDNPAVVNGALPDTLAWRKELAYNDVYVEYYFRHPSYNYYPVVGVTWRQAHDYCMWRTDRVNEIALIDKGYQNKNVLKTELNGGGQDNFNTKAYLLGAYEGIPGKPKNNELKDAQGRPRSKVDFSDGILFPDYRLPTEAEWEYAALGYVADNPQQRKSEKKRGEELIANKQIYAWKNEGFDNLRDTRHGTWQGSFLANFKRGNGDYMGTAGGLNDRSAIPSNVTSFYPNGYGLYNMSGNVNEWVADVYRPTTGQEEEDMNPFRGNVFTKIDKSGGEDASSWLDSMGHIKEVPEDDSTLRNRRNYNRSYAVNALDGDSLSRDYYDYGHTTLINDKSRVYKGGSWDDMPYWLSPGTRRYMQEDQSSSSIGFRCAMTHYGAPEGTSVKERTGNFFPSRRQKR